MQTITTSALLLAMAVGCDKPVTIPVSITTTETAAETEATKKPTYIGKGIGISDGDTITVVVDGKQKRVLLEGGDTPEIGGQAFSQAAKALTAKLSFGKRAEIFVADVDRYKRDIFMAERRGHQYSVSVNLGFRFMLRPKRSRSPYIVGNGTVVLG